jgi:hypothetical protein
MAGPIPFEFEGQAETKRFAPATLRNREAIAAVLRPILPASGLVLEIASGTGEHAVHFARSFPALMWQPSDPDSAGLASITSWADEAKAPNFLPPLMLDAASDWPVAEADAILCINMVHISPWAATQGLMSGAGRILPPGALLYLYGPYLRAGVPTAPSNIEFDASLKSRNPDWGLRHVEDVVGLAVTQGFIMAGCIEMPANNLSLVFRKL